VSKDIIQSSSSQDEDQVTRNRGLRFSKVNSRPPRQPASRRRPEIVDWPESALNSPTASIASAAPNSNHDNHPLPPISEASSVAHCTRTGSIVSDTGTQAMARPDRADPSQAPSIARSTQSTRTGSVVSDVKSHASAVSATPRNESKDKHPQVQPQTSAPPQSTTRSRVPSVASVAGNSVPQIYPSLPPSRDSSLAPSVISVVSSTKSKTYSALSVSTGYSRAPSTVSVVRSTASRDHQPLAESRAHGSRAPSVISVIPSAMSGNYSPLPESATSSLIQSAQPSRSLSIASVARNAVTKAPHPLPLPLPPPPPSVSRSPSIAPSVINVKKKSSSPPQKDQSRGPSRALSSQPPASTVASIAPSTRSGHTASTVSTDRHRVEVEHTAPVTRNGRSEADMTTSSRKPRVVPPVQDDATPAPERASSTTASAHSSVKSSRSKRGGSTISNAKSYVYEGDHERSVPDEPTSKRASSKVVSSKSDRKVSRDERGRSTTSRARNTQEELAEVTVTYEEDEDISTQSQSSSQRSSYNSSQRSCSVSSTDTIRPSDKNAMTVYKDDPTWTAKEVQADNSHRLSSRPKESRNLIDVKSYYGSDDDDMSVIRPDPSEVGGEQSASERQSQQQYEKYRQQQYPQYAPQHPPFYHPQQQYQQQFSPPIPQPYLPQYQPQYTHPHHHAYASPYSKLPPPPPPPSQAAYTSPHIPNLNPRFMNPQYMSPSYPTTNVNSPRYVAPKSQIEAYVNSTQEPEGQSGGRASKNKGKGREKAPQPVQKPVPIDDEWDEDSYIFRRFRKASNQCDRRRDR
jgi:hypothetical protein